MESQHGPKILGSFWWGSGWWMRKVWGGQLSSQSFVKSPLGAGHSSGPKNLPRMEEAWSLEFFGGLEPEEKARCTFTE